jgi:hypothetical protein
LLSVAKRVAEIWQVYHKVTPVLIYYTITLYEEVEVKIHAFLMSALDGNKFLTPLSGRFNDNSIGQEGLRAPGTP